MNREEILKRYESEKRAIMEHEEGPAIVVAGPGAGKTTILAEKYVDLCRKYGSNHVVAITFTNAAAEEMKKKVKTVCQASGIEIEDIHIGTMHSLAKGLIHRKSDALGIPARFRILSKDQEALLIQDVRLQLKGIGKIVGTSQNSYLKIFKAMKADFPEEEIHGIAKLPERESYATQDEFNDAYASLLSYYRALDWYEVVSRPASMLSTQPDVLSEVAGEIDYLLVDEYQDLNQADQSLIRLLASSTKALLVFGDDDQSIYETGRYANPVGVKRFSEIYPEARVYPISICWRCGSEIIRKAWVLVDVDEETLPERMPKDEPIPDPDRGKGQVFIMPVKSEKEEIKQVYKLIAELLSEEPPPEEILVLFHRREIGNKYIEAFRENGIQIEGLPESSMVPSERLHILHEILNLIEDIGDNLASRYLLAQFFGLSVEEIQHSRHISIEKGITLWEAAATQGEAIGGMRDLDEELVRWRAMGNPMQVVSEICDLIGEKSPELDDFIERCKTNEPRSVRAAISMLEKPSDDIDEQTLDLERKEGRTRVIAMTMHGAKGLGADVVIIPAVEDAFIPNDLHEPEQRRLLYVSMTRAKRALIISHAWSRKGKATHHGKDHSVTGRKRSRFLDEIIDG